MKNTIISDEKQKNESVDAGTKPYHLRLEEHNGDRSYYYDYLIYAKDREDARGIAEEYASDFYGDGGVKVEDDYWEFDCGAIAVEIETLREVSEAEYVRIFFDISHVLNPHGAKLPESVHLNS